MIKLADILEILGAQIGKGTEHDIYAAEGNPKAVVKVGDKATVGKWVKTFKSNPKIFPEVYKTGTLKDGRGYAVIEKLDTKKVIEQWHKMEMALELIGVVDTDVFESTIDQVFIDIVFGRKDADQIYRELSRDKEAQTLFKKWITFLVKTADYLMSSQDRGLDLHRYNFGYDKKGNIKALDI